MPDACTQLLASQEGREAALAENKSKQVPLHLAAYAGNIAAVEKLLGAQGSAAAVHDKSGKTPAQWAALRGYKVRHCRIFIAGLQFKQFFGVCRWAFMGC